MAHESFENVHTASILNKHFISIKVDREERPDVDKLYMTVVQALTGGGGWPMSVFLTPDLKPITGGTYFPPDDRYGRPGFPKILTLIAEKWRTDNEAVRNQGDTLTSAMSRLFVVDRGAVPNADDVASECYSHLADSFDEIHKGFGSAPKFPKPAELDFMLAFYAANKSTAEGKLAFRMVGETLEAMARGGIHDHIGLGFHRYSVDAAWHVPHFEKMLYDQAQLLSVYANASLIRSDMKKFAEDIAEYVHRNLTHPEGGFYSAEDADSLPSHEATEKREGALYVWTEQEIDDALKGITIDGDGEIDVAKCFKQYFNVQPNGNCPNHTDPHGELKWQNVLIMKDSHDGYASRLGLSLEKLSEVISKARDVLIPVRAQRPKPHLDDKMLTAWNGLMISGLARASIALRKPELAERASKAVNFIRKYLLTHEDGQLLRACYTDSDGNVVLNSKTTSAFADDYAFLIEGLLNLYEATFDEQLLKMATTLQEQMDKRFWDQEKNSGFFLNEADPSILMRVVEEQDGAEPSTNSVAAGNLVRLANIFDKESYRARANNILEGAAKRLDQYPVMLPKMVSALLTHARPGCTFVVCGSRDDPVTQQMLEEIHRSFLPNKSPISLDSGKDLWLVEQNEHFKTLMEFANQPTVFVCENFSCKTPITSLDGLKKALLSF